MRVSPAGATAAAMASSDSRLPAGDWVVARVSRAIRPEAPVRSLDGAPYVEDVATVSRATAVAFGAPSRARLAAGERGSRRSFSTPGAFGPAAVGTSSTYWATDDAPGRGVAALAGAASASVVARRATSTAVRELRVARARLDLARDEAGGTTE